MSENPWYSFYIGDYERDTAHLSLLEHGAYLKLMNHYYAIREPIPSNLTILYRICRAFSPTERRAVQEILAKFFQKHDDRYVNKRCDRELAKIMKFINRQSAAAQLRHMPRHSHGTPNPQPQSYSSLNGNSEKEESKQELSPAERDLQRAKVIAWHREKGIASTSISMGDYDWLESYEAKNGIIENKVETHSET